MIVRPELFVYIILFEYPRWPEKCFIIQKAREQSGVKWEKDSLGIMISTYVSLLLTTTTTTTKTTPNALTYTHLYTTHYTGK